MQRPSLEPIIAGRLTIVRNMNGHRNLYVPELMAEWTSETDEQYLIGRAAKKIADT